MSHDNNTPPDQTPSDDPLALRLAALATHSIASLAPMLELVDELLRDATGQYDLTAARVLMRDRERIVARLEQAVDAGRWISVEAAAQRTRRPEGTIRYWCRTKKIVARKIGPRQWEIDAQSLYRYYEAA